MTGSGPQSTGVKFHLEDTSQATGGGIRLRAIVLGMALAMGLCAITPFNNTYRHATPLGGGHFPLAPFFILVWLMILIALARHIFKGRVWLTGKEVLVSWILMVLVSGIAYTGLARTFFINLTAPYHFATVENRWQEVLHPLLPGAWYPQNPKAIKELYRILKYNGWALIAVPIFGELIFRTCFNLSSLLSSRVTTPNGGSGKLFSHV